MMRRHEMLQRYRSARYINDLELQVEQLEAVRGFTAPLYATNQQLSATGVPGASH